MGVVSFILQSKKNPASIYVRVRKGRKIDVKAKLEYKIDPLLWDTTTQMPKHTKTQKLKEIESFLSKIKSDILNSIEKDITEGKNIDYGWLQEMIYPNLRIGIPNKLIDFIDYYLLLKANSVKLGTIKKINTFKNLLIEFEKYSNKKYQINEIDLKFQLKLNEFANQSKYNYSPSYIADVVRFLKTLVYSARANGVSVNPQTAQLKVTKKKPPFIYLNEDDLDKIKNCVLNTDYLDNARDWLLISCDTGQRVSDFMRFNKQMLRNAITSKGNKVRLLEFKQVKTGKQMSIVVTDLVEEILKKRNGEFPRKISEQRYNDYIKNVCEIAGLNEIVEGTMKDPVKKRQITGYFPKYKLVVSHIGRRSFASNYFTKYQMAFLMNQTGHTSQKTFLDYVGKTNYDLALAFADDIIRLKNEI